MSVSLKIYVEKDPILLTEAIREIKNSEIKICSPVQPHRRPLPTEGTVVPLTEIIVALGSAGAFTALYQVICKFLDKDKEREVILEVGDTKVSIKGHSFPEEKELLERFAPELGEKGDSLRKL